MSANQTDCLLDIRRVRAFALARGFKRAVVQLAEPRPRGGQIPEAVKHPLRVCGLIELCKIDPTLDPRAAERAEKIHKEILQGIRRRLHPGKLRKDIVQKLMRPRGLILANRRSQLLFARRVKYGENVKGRRGRFFESRIRKEAVFVFLLRGEIGFRDLYGAWYSLSLIKLCREIQIGLQAGADARAERLVGLRTYPAAVGALIAEQKYILFVRNVAADTGAVIL